MKQIQLTANLSHKGVNYKPGDILEVREYLADALIDLKKAIAYPPTNGEKKETKPKTKEKEDVPGN